MKNFSEFNNIVLDCDEKAIDSFVCLGDTFIEAYKKDGSHVLVYRNGQDHFYAEISEENFDSLYNATMWESCGAISNDDARIAETAHQWLREKSSHLNFYRQGQLDSMIRVKNIDFIQDSSYHDLNTPSMMEL